MGVVKPLALEAFEQLAEAYARLVDTKPHNAYYERPATLSLLPDVAGLRVLDAGCGPGKRGNRLELERSVGVRPTAVRGCVRGDVVHAQYVDARLAEVQRHPDRE